MLENIRNNGFGCTIFGNIKSMERILVIQTAFLGDAILTLPLIQKLKELNPEIDIDVLTIPSTKDVFENSPSVSSVLSYDKRGKEKGLAEEVDWALFLVLDPSKEVCVHKIALDVHVSGGRKV